MDRYEYEIASLEFSMWTGKAKDDYLKILNDYGADGWRFVQFAPAFAKPKGAKKGLEMIFERKITSSEKSTLL